MAQGLDIEEDCTSQIDCLSGGGFEFVCRYYNTNRPAKNPTRAEAEPLAAAGLTTVAIWENGFPTAAAISHVATCGGFTV
jgi:hypothetical protein